MRAGKAWIAVATAMMLGAATAEAQEIDALADPAGALAAADRAVATAGAAAPAERAGLLARRAAVLLQLARHDEAG